MKLNSPFPQTLPKECTKAAKIFHSFVDTHNQGLDRVIPRSVLQRAKGFAIFSVFKAGFVFSARAGSGIVIAKLADGTWSAPSAIGTAGMGVGGQAGAEVTDFLIILNSRSAVKSFMAAGSLTLGGNMSIAVGPLGRNGEASSSVNTSGSLAMMYSYSKTKGLFGGVSVEGSVIVARQDANAQAYAMGVTAKSLLSGSIPPPSWAMELIRTLERCTGPPGGRNWIHDGGGEQGYAFGRMASFDDQSTRRMRTNSVSSFPPATWGKSKDGGSYFHTDPADELDDRKARPDNPSAVEEFDSPTYSFPTRFESENSYTKSSKSDEMNPNRVQPGYPNSFRTHPSSKSLSMLPPDYTSNPFAQSSPHTNPFTSSQTSHQETNVDRAPLHPQHHVAQAVAQFDFKAVEPGDLEFSKGDVINIMEKSDRTDDWWTGVIGGRQGIFPANFVALL
ncbi:hypothetical protein JB92DRAFT_3017897 [Gautieria morchelliformis]|nr:hypothetical protein JB92DRAFT_3017897 [Gautieria morchelliformis]